MYKVKKVYIFDSAPIALFVFARPDHTQRTLDALTANTLASQSELIVYADAARNEREAEKVVAVREIVHSASGFRSVTVVERDANYGLARNIIEGVSDTCSRYGRAIVLEDDLVTSPYFLEYMNCALERYAREERVMHVSGYMFPIKNDDLPETFFYRPASCWGWATWDRAWHYYEKDVAILEKKFSAEMKRKFNLDGAHDFWSQIEDNKMGRLNTWAIFWYASIFLRGGLCLHPARSFVNNIGHDGSGTHCGENPRFEARLADAPIQNWCNDMVENAMVLDRMGTFYRLSNTWGQRIANKLRTVTKQWRSGVDFG